MPSESCSSLSPVGFLNFLNGVNCMSVLSFLGLINCMHFLSLVSCMSFPPPYRKECSHSEEVATQGYSIWQGDRSESNIKIIKHHRCTDLARTKYGTGEVMVSLTTWEMLRSDFLRRESLKVSGYLGNSHGRQRH